MKLLDIGCGEGRNTVFFARNGYHVAAFDTSPRGLEKARRHAERANLPINVFGADINQFRLSDAFDILFSTGVLQYVPLEMRKKLFENYQEFTNPGD